MDICFSFVLTITHYHSIIVSYTAIHHHTSLMLHFNVNFVFIVFHLIGKWRSYMDVCRKFMGFLSLYWQLIVFNKGRNKCCKLPDGENIPIPTNR